MESMKRISYFVSYHLRIFWSLSMNFVRFSGAEQSDMQLSRPLLKHPHGTVKATSKNSDLPFSLGTSPLVVLINGSIPAVWESIRKGIIGRVHGTGLKEKIFWGAFSTKSFLQRWGLPGTGVLNAIVFNKIKEATGGRVRLSLSGGAPLAGETQHFMTVCVAPLLQGYGLTETCAYISLPDVF
jgi:long-chain acyl-CoA synthetase